MFCPSCETELPVFEPEAPKALPCPKCRTSLVIELFPAYFQADQKAAAPELASEADSQCYFHPDKKAVLSCAACGRYLCALCDLDFAGKHLCSTCLEKGQDKEAATRLEKRRTRHDRMSLLVALLGVPFWFLSFLSAPLVLYLSIRHFLTPVTVLDSAWASKIAPRLRHSLAILIALGQLSVWIFFIVKALT